MAASAEDALKSMILNLEQKTGREFGEWLHAFLKAQHVGWLKRAYESA